MRIAFAGLVIAACGTGTADYVPDAGMDAGPQPAIDAGVHADAGAVDASSDVGTRGRDSGCRTVDAGFADAGADSAIVFTHSCGAVRFLPEDAQSCFPPMAVWKPDGTKFTVYPDIVKVEWAGGVIQWTPAQCSAYELSDEAVVLDCRRGEISLVGERRWEICFDD